MTARPLAYFLAIIEPTVTVTLDKHIYHGCGGSWK
jgi:hypothetical protein